MGIGLWMPNLAKGQQDAAIKHPCEGWVFAHEPNVCMSGSRMRRQTSYVKIN